MFWKVVGYVRVRLSGDNILDFLNECRANDVELKNIIGLKNEYYADIISTRIQKAYNISKDFDVELGIIGRFGIAMKLFIYKNRIGFIASAAIFLILFALNSIFINEIIITGNNYLTDSQIESILSDSGIYRGKFIFSIKPDIIKEDILKKCNRLSWIWIDINGNCANVDVREKTSLPEFYDTSYSCNIVASREGVITEAIAQTGVLHVSEGTYVKEGDLLIGGVYDSSENAPVRFVRASGSVYAKTRYSLEDNYYMNYYSYSTNAKKITSFGIKLFGWSLETRPSPPQNSFLVKFNEKRIKIFGKKYLPLAFTNKQYCEIIKKECYSDKQQTEQRAVSDLAARLSASIPETATVVNTTKDIKYNSDGSIYACVTFECIENIAVENPIAVTKSDNSVTRDDGEEKTQ